MIIEVCAIFGVLGGDVNCELIYLCIFDCNEVRWSPYMHLSMAADDTKGL